jgi:hypothetical protein
MNSLRSRRLRSRDAQVESQELRDGHREARETVRVDRNERDPDTVIGAVLQFDTLDSDAGLALVEDDGLVIEDAPAVAHVGVDPGGVGATPGIDARCP